MKSWIFIPPAQAEALCDAQDDLCVDNFCFDDPALHQPWRDDDAGEPSNVPAPASRLSRPREAPSIGPAP